MAQSEQQKLMEIGRRLMNDPDMTITEAIKDIGETNKSKIRSLRAKYTANAEEIEEKLSEAMEPIDAMMPAIDLSENLSTFMDMQVRMAQLTFETAMRQQQFMVEMMTSTMQMRPTFPNPFDNRR